MRTDKIFTKFEPSSTDDKATGLLFKGHFITYQLIKEIKDKY